MTIERKIGRPSVYGFDAVLADEPMLFTGSTVELERIRSAALAFARRKGCQFITVKKFESLEIKLAS